jgi:Transposase DNA-binding/Transposase DDE domain
MNVPSIADEFAGAELGDERRTKRLHLVAESIANGPERSVPKATETDASLEACYRFLNNGKITPEAILAPHQRRTVERAREYGEVLVVHDTTSFKFSNEDSRKGLGPLLAKNGVRGFYAHVAMVVGLRDGVRDPLGVIGVDRYTRSAEPCSSKETKRITDPSNEYNRFVRLIEGSESLLKGQASPIHVIDREADVYELFELLVRKKQRFVIRSSDDRATSQRIEGTKAHIKLSNVVQGLENVAVREVPLSGRPKSGSAITDKIHPPREGRLAKLSFRATEVDIRRPDNLPRDLPGSIKLHLVHVLELDPPDGEKPVEWTLFTQEPISTPEDILRIVDIYRARWLIEELFKALKTGCRFEQRQFRSYEALSRLLAVMLPVAWRLLRIRTASRTNPDRPAAELLSETQLQVLIATSKRVKLPPNPTAEQAFLAIAGLGGHLKRNGRPGWRTLGLGFDALLERELGYVAALQGKM